MSPAQAADKRRDPLPEVEARAIIRLLGEVAAMPLDHVAQRRRLMDGLCEIIEADRWLWGMYCSFTPGAVPVATSMIHDGFSDKQYANFLLAIEHPDTAVINGALTREMAQKKTHLTRLRAQIDPDDFFPRSGAYPYWTKANVGDVIMSVRPLDERCLSVIGIYRPPGHAGFTARESRIAHIVLSETPWLHEQGWPEDRGVTVPTLSPRQRVTLNLLLDGKTRTQVAEHLGISPHTAHGYVKEVFQHFRIHSQAELIARFQQGNGGHQS